MRQNLASTLRAIVTARRLNHLVRPDSEVLVGLPASITYDAMSTEGGEVVLIQDWTPSDRVVSQFGTQVQVQAASVGSDATIQLLVDGNRLYVLEGIVFGPC